MFSFIAKINHHNLKVDTSDVLFHDKNDIDFK